MLNNWFKIVAYHSKKNKLYVLFNLLCLALGITAVLLSTLYWQEETSFDRWNANKEEVYFIESRSENHSFGYQPYVLSSLLKEHHNFVEDYLLYSGYFPTQVMHNKKAYAIEKILQTNASFFSFFPYKISYGSPSSIFKNPKEIALEKQKSSLIFGKGVNPIGEQIEVDDEWYTVVAVYDLGGKRSSFMPEAVVNDHQFIPEDLVGNWNYSSSSVLIKTKEGEKLAKAADQIYSQYYLLPMAEKQQLSFEEFEKKTNGIYDQKIVIHPLKGLHFGDAGNVVTPEANVKSTTLYVIVGLSWVLFVLSLFNYVNLSLSQTVSRAKEVGIRKVLGGSKRKIIQQALFETSLTMLLSFVGSFFMVLWILPFVNSFLGTHIVVHLRDALFLFVGVYLLVLLLGGLIPALYRANYQVLPVLKGNYYRSRSGIVLKNAFLILQFAIACWFISGTYIMYKQVNYMTTKSLGFSGDQVISFPFLEEEPIEIEERHQAYQTFKQEVLKIKGVEQMAFADLDYGSEERSRYMQLFDYEGENMRVAVHNVEAGYLEMMQVGLKEGRYLTNKFASDSIQNAVINESLLRQLHKDSIAGLVVNGTTIVGVVQDFHTAGFEHEISPKMFVLPSQTFFHFTQVSMKLDVHQLETILPAVEKLWESFHKGTDKPFEYSFMDQKFAKNFEKIKIQQQVMMGLSYLVIFIALFGLFAVSSYTIGTKLRAIAIRKVLGAETRGLIQDLSYQYLIYCIVGFGLSVIPSYYLLNEWLKGYAYRIEIGWEVYGGCLLAIVVLTLLIVVSRAYRATQINVLEYIKYE